MRLSILALLVLVAVSASGYNVLLGLKGLKLLKLKLLAVLKAPLLAPLAVASAGPIAFAHAKTHVAMKVAALTKIKHALLKLPVAFVSMKVGAVTGAHAGAKAGLLAFERSRSVVVPPAQEAHPSETEVPSYERKTPAYTPPAPAPTRPAPAYVPPAPAYVPPAPAYVPPAPAAQIHNRERRETEEVEDEVDVENIREAFAFMNNMDESRCVNRALCEIAVEPDIAMGTGTELLNFMNSLTDDKTAPWMPYKQAVSTGVSSKSRGACVKQYPTCNQSTEDLVEKALSSVE